MPLKIKNVQFKISATTAKQADIDALPQIAFAGRSNVGKSSLLNALAHQRQLARVSNTPGRTQSINLFLVDDAYYFADLPGYGFAKVPKRMKEQWGKQVRGYLESAPRLAGVVTIFDIRRDLREDDEDLLAWLAALGRPAVALVTKIDKLKKNELARRKAAWKKQLDGKVSRAPIFFSALNRDGKPDVLRALEELLEGGLTAADPSAFPDHAVSIDDALPERDG